MTIKKIVEIFFSAKQREEFQNGKLRKEWAKQYHQLFDKDDITIANNQPDKHFFEWLAAVLIYNSTGYLSLIEKYEFHNHKRKREILKIILNEEQLHILESIKGQCPDLFVYSPDYKEWFFCEIKGDTDRLRKTQEEDFNQIIKATKKPVYLIKFNKIQ